MTKAINVKGSFDTPEITLDPEKGLFEISGRSLPANSLNFYSEILTEANNLLDSASDNLLFKFKMDFISSSSTKIFQDLLVDVDNAVKKGKNIRVEWYYRLFDDDIKEIGEELCQDLDITIEYIAFE